jgi:hypothetical protein
LFTGQVGGGGAFYGAIVVFRYGEALLNYAEAKAELGTLTQNDLDISITLLRNRVETPAPNMATAKASIDPVLEAQYPNVSGVNKGVLLEIRRERRVELAGEGRRLWDLNRWYAGSLYGQHQQGIYIPAPGAYDVTGDGIDDVALLERVGDEASYPEGLSFYYFYDENGNQNTIYLENKTFGHIMITQNEYFLPNMCAPVSNMCAPLPNMCAPLPNVCAHIPYVCAHIPYVCAHIPYVCAHIPYVCAHIPYVCAPFSYMCAPFSDVCTPFSYMCTPFSDVCTPFPDVCAPFLKKIRPC